MTLGPLCAPCPLKAAGARGYAVSRGFLKHGVMIVAEALGEQEALRGQPLVGPSGEFVDRMIRRTPDPISGQLLDPADFLFTNTIRCRPPNNVLKDMPWEKEAKETCSPYLKSLIAELKPKAILALGDTAMQWFTGRSGITSLRGYAFSTPYGPVVPTYHPAFLLRGKHNWASIWIMDLLKALTLARNGGKLPKMEGRYLTHPSPQEARAWTEKFLAEATSETRLSFDLETPYASDGKDEEIEAEEFTIEDDASYTILMCSFSYKEKEAISMPWMPPYIDMIKQLLAHPCVKVGWNVNNFDIPRLVANGAPVNGPVIDGMDAWHFLFPAFRMGLKYVATFYRPDVGAWKLQSKEKPQWYNCVDADVALCCVNGILGKLEEQGRLRTFMRHFVDLGVVLRKISKRGIPVDLQLRKEARERFQGMYDAELQTLQGLIPESVKPLDKIYKKSGEEGEAWLRKKGSWVEGRMVKVKRMEPAPKPKKEKAPKPSTEDGSPSRALKPKKERKKKSSQPSPIPSAPDAAQSPISS
jgi:uracil-DNA glycosylase family 4